jgi:hypothetical protein
MSPSDLVSLNRVCDHSRRIGDVLPATDMADAVAIRGLTSRGRECADLLAQVLGHAQAAVDTMAGEDR